MSTTCNGCRYHSKDPNADIWIYEDGSPRDDLCSHPRILQLAGFTDSVPVFNSGCRLYEAVR